MFKKYFLTLILISFILTPFISHAFSAADPSGYFGSGNSSFNEPVGETGPTGQAGGASSGCTKPQDIGSLFTFTLCLMSGSVIPFLIGLGLIIFLVGLVGYVSAGDNEEKREAGRGLILFGIITLFVMVSVWGLVKIIYTTFFNTPFEVNSSSPIKFVQ